MTSQVPKFDLTQGEISPVMMSTAIAASVLAASWWGKTAGAVNAARAVRGDKEGAHSRDFAALQAEEAVQIIREGAKSGASEIEITLSQEAGGRIGGKIAGHSIKMTLGSSGNMTMKVKYKDVP